MELARVQSSTLILFGWIALLVQIVFLNSNQVACHLGGQSRTPNQWIEQYACQPNDTRATRSSWSKYLFGDECARDASSWRMNYVDELGAPYSVRVRESSLDERLVNMIDTVRYMRTHLAPFGFRLNPRDKNRVNEQTIAGPQVDDRVCGEHLRQMLALVGDLDKRLEKKRRNLANYSMELNEQDIHLARVLDAFGHYESGFFSGRRNSLGNYDQCINSQLLLKESGQDKLVATRYCWAQFNLEKHLHPSLDRNKEKFSKYFYKRNILAAAICIPETCHSKSFTTNRQLFQLLAQQRFQLPKSTYLSEQLELQSIFCLVDDNSDYLKWPLGAILFLLALTTWILLTICITLRLRTKEALGHHQHHQHPQYAGLLTCLDLARSWNDLLDRRRTSGLISGAAQQPVAANVAEPSPETRRVNLNALNGPKVLATFLVVLSHSFIFTWAHSTNALSSTMMSSLTHPSATLIKLYLLLTDSFFVISGMVVCYSALTRLECSISQLSNGPTSTATRLRLFLGAWLKMAASRYLRLVPLLLLAAWFEQNVFLRLGAGPLWDHGLDQETMAGECQAASWWRPLDFTNDQEIGCVPPAWFLYCDLFAHLMVVSPLVLMLAMGHAKLVYLIAFAWISVWPPAALSHYYSIVDPALDYELRQLRWSELGARNNFHPIFISKFYRVARVLIGVLAGHAIYLYDCRGKANNKGQQRHDNEATMSQLETENTREKSVGPTSEANQLATWPHWFRGPATHFALTILGVTAILLAFEGLIKQHLGASIYQAAMISGVSFNALFWCAANAILFMRLTTDWRHHWLAQLGTNQLVKTTNKLGFGLYLYHWDILLYIYSTATTTIHYTSGLFYLLAAAVYSYALVVSVFMFVFIESPLTRIIGLLIRK